MPREEQRHNTVSFMMRCYLFFTPESELPVAAGCRKERWKRSQVLRVILLALKRIHQVELRPMMSLRQTRKIKNQIKLKKRKNGSVGMGNKRWSRQTVVLTAIDTVVMDYMKVNNTQEPLTKLLVETHALSNGGTSCKEPVS